MNIREYLRPDSLEDAYELVSRSPGNVAIGGLTAIKLRGEDIETAVDLSSLGLDYIREESGQVHIGAMTSLRSIERSEACGRACSGILAKAVGRIGGVQLRNHATLGGAVVSLWSSSDTLSALLAVDAELSFYRAGKLSMESFLERPVHGDILTEISIPDPGPRCAQEATRISYQDAPLLTVAVSARGREARIAVGARPSRAVLAKGAMRSFATGRSPRETGQVAGEELEFGDDFRASAWYRKDICAVLVERALDKVVV
jgi:CO/xanthine dehydrogenase FAD-binding subunit